jgi:hypothetical protein
LERHHWLRMTAFQLLLSAAFSAVLDQATG